MHSGMHFDIQTYILKKFQSEYAICIHIDPKWTNANYFIGFTPNKNMILLRSLEPF